MVGGIKAVAEGLAREFRHLLPGQRKTQRNSLALLAATMLEVRSANLMDLAAALPREAERTDMRYQWIARVLGNGLIDPDAVMAPFAREVLARAAGRGALRWPSIRLRRMEPSASSAHRPHPGPVQAVGAS